jgi:hypothetical protein
MIPFDPRSLRSLRNVRLASNIIIFRGRCFQKGKNNTDEMLVSVIELIQEQSPYPPGPLTRFTMVPAKTHLTGDPARSPFSYNLKEQGEWRLNTQ